VELERAPLVASLAAGVVDIADEGWRLAIGGVEGRLIAGG
jgi:hypothetical protein